MFAASALIPGPPTTGSLRRSTVRIGGCAHIIIIVVIILKDTVGIIVKVDNVAIIR